MSIEEGPAHGKAAAGPAGVSARDQALAAALDTLRDAPASFLVAVETEDGIRLVGNFTTLAPIPDDATEKDAEQIIAWAGRSAGLSFLCRVAETVNDAITYEATR